MNSIAHGRTRRVAFSAVLLLAAVSVAGAAELIQTPRLLPMTQKELGDREKQKDAARKVTFLADRNIYWNDDGQGQFVAVIGGDGMAAPDHKLRIALSRGADVVDRKEIALGKEEDASKVVFLLNVDALKPGKYTVTGEVIGPDGKRMGSVEPCEFAREDKSRPNIAIPADGIPVEVQPQDVLKDAAWPITTGIPMPFGAVKNISRLQLFENGRPIPAQWTPRARWTPGEPTSHKWIGLDFVARYDNGVARQYRIREAAAAAMPDRPKVSVSQTADLIEVENGIIRFQVSRRRFNGVYAAWLDTNGDGKYSDDELLIRGTENSGQYLVDEKGQTYRAADDAAVEVRVEEEGPIRVTILARGWYVNPKLPEAERKLCQFVTRITVCVGQPDIEFTQRTVITADTAVKKFADIGFRVPVSGAERWVTGLDGKTVEGALPPAEQSIWLHQERSDRVRLMSDEKATPLMEGKRSDGWIAVSGSSGAAAALLRDIWQKFPKELGADRAGLLFHFWPQHGRETFTEAEQLDVRNIYKCWFAEQGQLLDMQLPKAYSDRLEQMNAKANWDYENSVVKGKVSTGEGTAIGNDFALLLQPKSAGAESLAVQSRLFQENPHALAASSWLAASLVFGPLAPRDDRRWPEAERFMNEDFPRAMLNMCAFLGDYGMWICANTHNTWRQDLPELHRVLQHSHYQHVGLAWMLYARGGSPALRKWARAQTDNFMDVGTVNYDNPEEKRPYHTAGDMHHCKAFVPWVSIAPGMKTPNTDAGYWGHFIDPDAFLYRYYIEGNLRAHDLYQIWSEACKGGFMPVSGNGRETINTFAMMLNYYEATWDPQAIIYWRAAISGILATPLEDAPAAASFPVWHKNWPDRYYGLTRDRAIVAPLKSWIAAGYSQPAINGFVARVTGDKSYVAHLAPRMLDEVRQVYVNPDDPLDRFSDYSYARGEEDVMQIPYFLNALESVGITSLAGAGEATSYYPSRTILALNPDGREFKVKVELSYYASTFAFEVHVRAPSGKTVVSEKFDPKEKKKTRYDGPHAESVTVPAGGEKGIYVISLIGDFPAFAAPVTDLPHEVAVALKGAKVRVGERQSGFMALPPDSSGTLTLTAMGYGTTPMMVIPGATAILIQDAQNQPVLETTLLDIGKRKTVSVTLKSEREPQVWPFCILAQTGPMFDWAGPSEALFLSKRADDLAAILLALPSGGVEKLIAEPKDGKK